MNEYLLSKNQKLFKKWQANIVVDSNGCHIWQGCCSPIKPYVSLRGDRCESYSTTPQRVMLASYLDRPLVGIAFATCLNILCINPAHLREGRYGNRSGEPSFAKPVIVNDIIYRTTQIAARAYNVSVTTIKHWILRGIPDARKDQIRSIKYK